MLGVEVPLLISQSGTLSATKHLSVNFLSEAITPVISFFARLILQRIYYQTTKPSFSNLQNE